jgi:hypothetical protein
VIDAIHLSFKFINFLIVLVASHTSCPSPHHHGCSSCIASHKLLIVCFSKPNSLSNWQILGRMVICWFFFISAMSMTVSSYLIYCLL